MVPSQIIRFLGYTIDSTRKKIFLPEDKVTKVQNVVKSVQTSLPIMIQAAMLTLGLLAASIPTVQWARLHSRDLQQTILQNWNFGLSLQKQITIPSRGNYGGGGIKFNAGFVLNIPSCKETDRRKLLGMGRAS